MPKKYDKEGAYVRRWLPQLKNFPSKYIYEPWLCPIVDQKKAGCIIGIDYPKPIVEHDTVSKANMGRMAKAYEANKKAASGASSSGGGSGGSGSGTATAKAIAGGKRPLAQQKLAAAGKKTKS